jgi:acyl-CoA thioesterase
MGGVAHAAAIEAAEIVSGKPLLWSTIQFVNAGLLNQSIDIQVELLGGGRSISQVLVTLTADGTGSSNHVWRTRRSPGELSASS